MGKTDSYIGFAVRSGRIVFGIDNVERYRKRMYALVICPTASDNLRESARRFAERKAIPLVTVDRPLEDIVFKSNCKLEALTDANMAKAVIENAGR